MSVPDRVVGRRDGALAGLAGLVGMGMVIAPLAAMPAFAVTTDSAVFINEIHYDNAGPNNGADVGEAVEVAAAPGTDLTGWDVVLYNSSNGLAYATTAVPAAVGDTSTVVMEYPTNGIQNGDADGIALVNADDEVVEFLSYEGTLTAADGPASGLTSTDIGVAESGATPAGQSLQRTGTGDSADDFTWTGPAASSFGALNAGQTFPGTPGEEPVEEPGGEPGGEPGEEEPGEEEPAAVTPIADIQGSGAATPLEGKSVTTRGVVTAAYPTGGYAGYYIQTPGTGATVDGSSDAVFVYSPATVASVSVGDYVEVTGPVSDSNGPTYSGLTQISVAAGAATVLDEEVTAPVPAAVAITADSVQRESLEGMLIAPTGDYTVTDNYDTNYYGSIVLTPGDEPLVQPTAVVEPGSAEYTALLAANQASMITLDDGATTNFNSNANKATPLPYLSNTAPVRIGAAVEFTTPVILDYRFDAWELQPLTQLTAANAATVQPATFENTRTPEPEDVGGDVTFATFNVLNYFATTGDELTGCRYYTDRDGDPVTVDEGCDARGAADQEDLDRQQDKIVAAINALDADVVGLEEIENSAKFGKDRDAALAELVDALNDDAGEGTWDYVRSPADRPAIENEDVIRTAFIFKPEVAETVGDSVILDDETAFSNAREPLAQAFQPVDGEPGSEFLAIVNHFKSKGSGSGAGDADAGDGQGASNGSRVRQANSLVAFADQLKADTGIQRVLLAGDFNSYLQEDPIDVLIAAGYADLGSTTGEETYAFDGMIGSLDHVFVSEQAADDVTGTDIWNINSVESIALEYSRYNYNATNFYRADQYRASDHDPILVGLDLDPDPVTLNLLNFNDFHGRIDANTTKFAGTIEQLRAEQGEDSSLLLSAGDNFGASLFASATQQDEPTIDVLNALDLRTSAVGNHEFDQGSADLEGRVLDRADFSYLGANVYDKGTQNPALQEYEIFEVQGVRIGVIGAVTQEVPSLVSPGGITTLDFGDPVEAVNRVADELSDGDEANGEADILVAEYHAGASTGEAVAPAVGSTLAAEVLKGGEFANIVNNTSAEVDAIFNGHTHQRYAWDAPIPGSIGTRPVVQAGNYGEFIGQIVLTVDPADGDVLDYEARTVGRTTTAEADLVAAYPRVAAVKTVVDAALKVADVRGSVVVGGVTADITTAFTEGAYTNGIYSGSKRDNRGAESTLGNLVADALLDTLDEERLGGAEIGIVNPGGLRGELLYAPDGKVTYAEANGVLPFVNNLWTTTLTGAQFKTVLEQQWQRTAAGAIPSDRPFLKLGLSENVQYTFDANLPEGQRITGIWVNGEPIDPSADYRIGSFSFLLQGGDNFREFANGTDTRDSGLIDRDAWVSYLQANTPVSPDFAKRSASVSGAPTQEVQVGDQLTLQVSELNLTSLGSPENTTLDIGWTGSTATFASVPVVNGAATVVVTVPADAPASSRLVLTARPTGTTVTIPVSVEGGTTVPGDGDNGGGDGDNGGDGGSGDGGPGTNPGGGDGTGNGGTGTGNGGTGANGTGNTGFLSSTGAEILPGLGLATLLLLIGSAVVILRRRRSTTDPEA